MNEIIERKGAGHPDTIADNLGEEFAKLLKIAYKKDYGKVMHYNVDKVLVGSGKIDYKKHKMIKPVNIVFAGQYTHVKGDVKKLMESAVQKVLKREISKGLKYKIHDMLTGGSPDLADNFNKRKCNDTSFGVGNPYTQNEKLVLKLGKYIDNLHKTYDWVGTDNKVMFIDGEIVIALALIEKDYEAYSASKEYVIDLIKKKFGIKVNINNADTEDGYFNTITGTSMEQGDAGMTGRGNRYNGLITPLRLMTLEAYYGKNDVTHIGRIYQKMAQSKADKTKKSVLLVNKIGGKINRPIVVFKD